MKKFYSLAFMALGAFSMTASHQVIEVAQSAEGLSVGTPMTEIKAQPGRVTLSESFESKNVSTRHNARAKAPETSTDWASIGEGTYLEDLLTVYSDVPTNQMWKVDVETSASNPGWYRFLPYASGPVAQLLGATDTSNYLYINASDPNKVYGLDFDAFGRFSLSNYVAESGWEGNPEGYGTLVDGCISFPVNSWAIGLSAGWGLTTKNTGMKLFLPGAEVVDYSLSVNSTAWCGTDNKVVYSIKAGTSVAAIKALLIAGEYPMSETNASIVAQNGQAISAGNIAVIAQKQGIHSLLVIALDADDNVQAAEASYFFGDFEKDDDWKSIGTGQFTEGIYFANYDDIENETFDIEVQESKTTPGRYRIVSPYANHSSLGKGNITADKHGHGHYMYIDATQADRVYIEPSVIGLDGPYGHAAVNSYGAKFVGTSAEEQAKTAGYFGTFDADTRTISYPDDMILLGEKGYNNGAFIEGNTDTKIVLPESAGVDGIAVDNNTAEVEYYNLQGVRVSNPAAGQLVIKRQGTEVSKTIVR